MGGGYCNCNYSHIYHNNGKEGSESTEEFREASWNCGVRGKRILEVNVAIKEKKKRGNSHLASLDSDQGKKDSRMLQCA